MFTTALVLDSASPRMSSLATALGDDIDSFGGFRSRLGHVSDLAGALAVAIGQH